MPVKVYPETAGGGVAIGDTVTDATAGSVFFAGASGVLAQNNAAFKWTDNTQFLVTTTSESASEPAMKLVFAGWDGAAYTHGLLIKTTDASAYGATQIRLEGAYGTNGTIRNSAYAGLDFSSYNLSQARFNFGDQSWIVGTFSTDSAEPSLTASSASATRVPLLVQLAAAQTADALQVKNSGGTAVFGISGATPAVGAPQVHFGTSTTGIWGTSNTIEFTFSGVSHMMWDFANNATRFDSLGQLSWSNTSANPGATNDVGIGRSSAGILKITNASTGGGALHMEEQTAPSAPSANNVYIYAQDNGAGKTQLMALFGSGVAQQIAIEP